jgi:hypothetical protein
MTQLIEFLPDSREVELGVPSPVPARTLLPDWYKESKSFYDGNTLSFDTNYSVQSTIKQCIPVLDSLTAGYIQPSWTEVYIEDKETDFFYAFPNGPTPIRARSVESFQQMPIPEGFHKQVFAWERYWGIKTPPGYSTLITMPPYRDDLPFRCVTGIIDTDKHHTSGAVSFFVQKGFTGVIPIGTPLFQMIPFKRDDWKSVRHTFEQTEELQRNRVNVRNFFVGGYKKLYWSRKSYE